MQKVFFFHLNNRHFSKIQLFILTMPLDTTDFADFVSSHVCNFTRSFAQVAFIISVGFLSTERKVLEAPFATPSDRGGVLELVASLG